LSINSNVICVIRIMLAILNDTFFQRIEEHKHSAIGKHLRDTHKQKNTDLREQFTILKKCRGKFKWLIYEMLFIQEKKPELNTQSDSKQNYLVPNYYPLRSTV